MSRSQPMYLIQALKSCKTHSLGAKIVYTGPRSQVANGWKVLSRVHHHDS